jgi:hypothetical protein
MPETVDGGEGWGEGALGFMPGWTCGVREHSDVVRPVREPGSFRIAGFSRLRPF